jgi:ATP phosphoribosyltransferase regulatory subunit
MKTHWRLPRGVDELLPPRAWHLEMLRRKVLDVFVTWGYDYVDPPIIEYLDSLLVGSGEDLDLQTLKVVDQVSGRQLGVRADMTSQAVRIDAHSKRTEGVQRLCYAGPVVYANPEIAQSSRVPFKVGAELFGAPGLDADREVVQLMLEVVHAAGVDEPVLLLGHMGIYRGLTEALIAAGDLDADDESQLFKCVQRKAQSDIAGLLRPSPLSDMMVGLPMLMGNDLDEATRCLDAAPERVGQALGELHALADRLDHNGFAVRFDVAELSGYGYHNGPVFAVYHPEHGSALAQGGRYDGVGAVFGRARAATGFDINLKQLLGEDAAEDELIFAPWELGQGRSDQRDATVASLRANGRRVRVALSEEEAMPIECTSLLVEEDGEWRVVDRPRD